MGCWARCRAALKFDLQLLQVALKFDLQLMSSVSDVRDIPKSGKNLVIIADVQDKLCFRIFDAYGNLVVDTNEMGLMAQAGLIADLRSQLKRFWAPRKLTSSEKEGVFAAVTSILGQTPTLAPGGQPFDLGVAWLEIEHKAQRPLVVVLDQAEATFTRPRADSRPEDEVRELFEAVHEAFAHTRARAAAGSADPQLPQGVARRVRRDPQVARSHARHQAHDASTRWIVPGWSRRSKGRRTISVWSSSPDRNSVQPGERTLAEFMTNDLFDTLADPQTEQESPIAPTLQILLTRMWKEANDPERLRGRPTFDRVLYQELKGKGFKLNEVIQEQFDKIAGDGGPARGGREGAAA